MITCNNRFRFLRKIFLLSISLVCGVCLGITALSAADQFGTVTDALAWANTYGQDESNVNYMFMRRISDPNGPNVMSDDDKRKEINQFYAIKDSLTSTTEKAKQFISADRDNKNFRYLRELIEKAEYNHGYGLNAGTLKLVIQDMNTAMAHLENPVTYSSINSGETWFDNNGSAISAHGGGTIKVGDTYYWYGEDNRLSYDLRTGVSCYSSTDLYNWTYEGIALSVFDMDYDKTDDVPNPFYTDPIIGSKGRIERPKVIYNETTKKYVMWMHLELAGGYGFSPAGVAVSDSPTGPFTYLWHGRPVFDRTLSIGGEIGNVDVSNQTFRDMSLVIDVGVDQNGDGVDDAYTIYSSEENNTLYIVRLDRDYTWVDLTDVDPADTAVFTWNTSTGTFAPIQYQYLNSYAKPGLTDKQLYAYVEYQNEAIVNPNGSWTRHHRENQREAPAPFKYKNNYYIITSGATGWNPNRASYYMSESILGPYQNMGDPCIGDTNKTTFASQSTAVISIDQQKGEYVYMGDRWKNNNHVNGDVKSSTYVWLPIEFDDEGKISMRWYDEWTYDVLGKSILPIPAKVVMLGKDTFSLPEKVELKTNAGASEFYAVDWSIDPHVYITPGIYTVSGIVPELKISVQADVTVLSPEMRYFVNCNYTIGTGCADYDTWVQQLKSSLLNTKADASFQTDLRGTQWGYYDANNVGNTASDASTPFGTGHYRKNTAVSGDENNGFGYKFELPAGTYGVTVGMQNPWSTRTQCVYVQNENIATVKLEQGIPKMASTMQAVVNNEQGGMGILNVYFKKQNADGSNHSDPIASWIMVYPITETPTGEAMFKTKINDASHINTASQTAVCDITIEAFAAKYPQTVDIALQITNEKQEVVGIKLLKNHPTKQRIKLSETMPLQAGGQQYTLTVFVADKLDNSLDGFALLSEKCKKTIT